jgi:hypothetical protein
VAWLAMMALLRHPAFDEILSIAASLPLGRFLRAPAPARP